MALSTADWLDKQAKSKNHRLDVMPYRTGEVAVLLGLDPRTIRKYVELGEIPGFRVGKQWLYPKEAINNLLNQGKSDE
jgi:excisionase family DNA binding protein